MMKFKTESCFREFLLFIKEVSKTTYEDITTFAEDHHLRYGIVCLDEENDSLYVKTNTDGCFIAPNGEVELCTGKYIALVSDCDYASVKLEVNKDLETILHGDLDIVCINKPFEEEDPPSDNEP